MCELEVKNKSQKGSFDYDDYLSKRLQMPWLRTSSISVPGAGHWSSQQQLRKTWSLATMKMVAQSLLRSRIAVACLFDFVDLPSPVI